MVGKTMVGKPSGSGAPAPAAGGKRAWAMLRTAISPEPLPEAQQPEDSPEKREQARQEFLARSEQVARAVRRLQRFSVNPKGRFLRRWDQLMVAAMTYTAIITPFEVAFITARTPWVAFAINRVVDLVFCVDIGLTFVIPFRLAPKDGARWVYSPLSIARNYLRSW